MDRVLEIVVNCDNRQAAIWLWERVRELTQDPAYHLINVTLVTAPEPEAVLPLEVLYHAPEPPNPG